jgi:hypothetical protein
MKRKLLSLPSFSIMICLVVAIFSNVLTCRYCCSCCGCSVALVDVLVDVLAPAPNTTTATLAAAAGVLPLLLLLLLWWWCFWLRVVFCAAATTVSMAIAAVVYGGRSDRCRPC